MIRIENLSRRRLLGGMATSGLWLGFSFGPLPAMAKPKRATDDPNAKLKDDAVAFQPSVFVGIAPSGTVTIMSHRAEMGQGVKTSLPVVLADEMRADWRRVKVRQAEGDPRYGDQDTDGSRSIRLFYTPMRMAGAAVRQMLESAAALTWSVAIPECRAEDHLVIHVPSGRTLGFGELVKAAASLPPPPPEEVELRDVSSQRYVGHPIPSVDLADMLSGKAIYGADVTFPGMKYASIERCPVYGGALKSFDPKPALAFRGVEKVIEIPTSPMPSGFFPLPGIAVIASNSWAAIEGRKKLTIDWDRGPNATHDSSFYQGELTEIVRHAGRPMRNNGNPEAALNGAKQKVVAEYSVPYLAHATMEPPVAVARMVNGKLEIFAPTQDPQGARATVATYLGMKEAEIVIRPTLLGGGFGRKSMHDFVCEAAFLAKTLGAPVRVTWTREDDLRHDYYHAMSVQHLEAGLDRTGKLQVWLHRTAFPPVVSTFKPNMTQPEPSQLAQGVVDMPYHFMHVRCESGAVGAHTRIGWSRAMMHVPHAFAVCSFIDELAVAAQKDPATFIFQILDGPGKLDPRILGIDYPNDGASLDDYPIDLGRMQSVLQLVQERAGWGTPLLPGQGRGIAVHRSFLTYIAGVALVSIGKNGAITVPRFDVAVDCGIVVNPDRVRAQVEGGVIFGIGATLFSKLTFKDGAVVEGNFDTYQVPRLPFTPETRVYVVPSNAPPAGIVDPPVPVVAPAICNAIYAATGQRFRSLPIDLNVTR